MSASVVQCGRTTPLCATREATRMSGERAVLSFLTFNLFADLPAFRHLDRRLEIAAQAIAAQHPGVVALQEVVRARACGEMDRKICDLVNGGCKTAAAYRIDYAA